MGDCPAESFKRSRGYPREDLDIEFYRNCHKSHESYVLELVAVRIEVFCLSLRKYFVEYFAYAVPELYKKCSDRGKDPVDLFLQVYASCKLSESLANSSRVRVSALRPGSMPAAMRASDKEFLS